MSTMLAAGIGLYVGLMLMGGLILSKLGDIEAAVRDLKRENAAFDDDYEDDDELEDPHEVWKRLQSS